MKTKKALSVLCALALVLALAVPAFASLSTDFGSTNDIPDTVGTITVSVPASNGTLYINESGAPYALKDDTTTVTGMTVKGYTVADGFFSTAGLLVNSGELELSVKVTITSTAQSAIIAASIADDASAGNATGGNISVPTIAGNLEVATAEVDGTEITVNWAGAETAAIPTASSTNGSTASSATPTIKTLTTTLPAAETDDAGDTTNGYLAYRLAGDYQAGAAAWDDTTNEVSVKVAFTLTPVTGG